MEIENKTIIDVELSNVDNQIKIENRAEEKAQEEEIRNEYGDFTRQLKPVVQNMHTLLFNKVLMWEVEEPILNEMSECFITLLEKYMPKAEVIGKYAPEIAYISLIGIAFIQSTNKKTSEILDAKPIKENE